MPSITCRETRWKQPGVIDAGKLPPTQFSVFRPGQTVPQGG